MSQNMLDHGGPSPSSDLLRTGFHVRTESGGGVTVLRLVGELDVATAVELRRAVAGALEQLPSILTLDISGLSFVDSTGIGVLVGASRRAHEIGASFILLSPTRPVQKALHLTGVDQLMRIETQPSDL